MDDDDGGGGTGAIGGGLALELEPLLVLFVVALPPRTMFVLFILLEEL